MCVCHNGRTIINVEWVGGHRDMFNMRLLPFLCQGNSIPHFCVFGVSDKVSVGNL